MATSRLCTLLLLVALTACSSGSNPTEPGSSPLPMGIAKATALQNLALIRTLQNQKKAGTFLGGLSSSCVDLSGRLCAESAWTYSFVDRTSGPGERIYNWHVWDTGRVQEFEPVPPTGPVSGLDIGPFLNVDSGQAVEVALAARGNDYLQMFPDGAPWITYRHFANEVRAHVLFRSLSTSCQVEVQVSATTAAVLFVDDHCLSGAS